MQGLIRSIIQKIIGEQLPDSARMERQRDHANAANTQPDPGPEAVVKAHAQWLCAAQDTSASHDGGVARDFSLIKGWASSYPETTGYIIPTMIDLAKWLKDDSYHARARKMLDWCVSIQFPEGGFQGGKIDAQPRVPVTFNTGQILLGLAAGAREYKHPVYHDAMLRAAGWLRDTQDTDGCWRKHPTPFANFGEKAYETHVAWGLFEAERIAPGQGFAEAGLRQVKWALTKQHPNGWFESNCLNGSDNPFTHTIGYVLRGILEAYLLTPDDTLLAAATRTADSLVSVVAPDGRLAGRLDANWKATADYVCLTGSVQIAHCLFILHQLQKKQSYLEAGKRLNSYVRRTVQMDGPAGQRGGLKGSFPVDGEYGRWEYLNWAAKFSIDANLLEIELCSTNTH